MADTTKPARGLELLWNAHIEELKSMPDAQIMEGVDLPRFRTDRIQLMASAKAEAARRMAATGGQPQAVGSTPIATEASMSVAEARAFLREAANSGLFAMAADALDSMSDEDALRNCAKAKRILERNRPTE